MSDITELFNRDPLSLTDQDVDAIIEAMREQRHTFNNVEKKPGTKSKLTEKQSNLLAQAGDLKIEI